MSSLAYPMVTISGKMVKWSQFFPALPIRGKISFSTPGFWAGLVTGFSQENAARVTLSSKPGPQEVLHTSSLHCYHHINKPRLARWMVTDMWPSHLSQWQTSGWGHLGLPGTKPNANPRGDQLSLGRRSKTTTSTHRLGSNNLRLFLNARGLGITCYTAVANW